LRHKNIKALSFIAEKEDYQEYEMPKFIEIPELILINHGKYRVDHALDDLHFGVNSHQKLSEILYKRIIA
jgi:hypothetical protein